MRLGRGMEGYEGWGITISYSMVRKVLSENGRLEQEQQGRLVSGAGGIEG